MMYFITGNRHKYEEVKKIIGPGITMRTVPYPEIQAETLEEVATYGINYLKDRVDGAFFIEDSGLFIEVLNGFPGVFSAYVFRAIGNEGILKILQGEENRKARFMSVMGYYDGEIHLFTGVCEGIIAHEIRGKRGFGYDPIFIPKGDNRTFAEMVTEEKNRYSHRGKSALMLKKYLEEKER